MRTTLYRWILLIILSLLLTSAHAADPTTSVLQPNDRIVFVGDSITGLGWNNGDGFIHLIDAALRQAHPGSNPVVIPLGGSGQTVSSWLGVEKNSREKSSFLDVKGFDVKEALDKPADVLVIMLGMNDLLAPYVADTQASQDTWAAQYRQLLAALRERVKPRVIALATITMYTEDPTSIANRVRDALNRRVATIAQDEKLLLLPAGQRMQDILREGRMLQPDFHVTYDFVHPNRAGHVAIATAMLDGLGEHAAAQQLADKYLPAIRQQAAPTRPALSFQLEPLPGKLADAAYSFKVHYWYTPAADQPAAPLTVRLRVPKGWQVTPETATLPAAVFTVTGPADHLKTMLTLEANSKDIVTTANVAIPAPWLVAAGAVSMAAWPAQKFDPIGARLPGEEKLIRGESLGQPIEVAPGQQLTWQRNFASVDFPGGADPESVNLLAASFYQHFSVAYAARWIYSTRERPVKLTPGTRAFSGNNMITLWVNGDQVYAGPLTKTPAEAKLREGWNLLLYRTNHFTWQWQVTLSLAGVEGDDLADLHYSTQLERPAGKPS